MSQDLHTVATRRPHPAVDIEDWRRRKLLEFGFQPALAASLAAQRRLDLHELLQLVDRGCPPELAARILAPIPTWMGS